MKSLLSTVGLDSLILDVFIILAVVIAAALVIYFVWEAVAAYVNKVKNSDKQETKKEKEKESNIDFSNFELDAENKEETSDELPLTEVDEVKAEEEKSQSDAEIAEQDRLNAERRAYLEAKRQELIRRMQEDVEAEEETEQESENEETETEENTEEVVEDAAEEVETVEEEQPVEEVVSEENAETEEVVDSLEEERNALVAEKEKYEAMVKELEVAKAELAKQKTEVEPKVVPTNGVLSLDELKARLAETEEKQKVTDKEFKQCKKEFTPLHKVWTTHEKDERKLRRKEALVAKQKVILYGVNNYADIDEEKAQKLAEDLDLLDGLKLSVQHCEEVMEKNAERYPLLEKMYTVLKARNEELKADIEYYRAEIAKLEGTQESAEADAE